MTVKELITAKEAARRLGVKPATLQQWRGRRRRPLRYLKVGTRIWYRPADVEQFLESLEKTPGEPQASSVAAPKRRKMA